MENLIHCLQGHAAHRQERKLRFWSSFTSWLVVHLTWWYLRPFTFPQFLSLCSALCQQGQSKGFRRVVCFPNRDELEETLAGFKQLSGFQAFSMTESIYRCHVRIVPSAAFAVNYFNRKLFHSTQFQTICDHKGLSFRSLWMFQWASLALCMMSRSSDASPSLYTSCNHLQVGATSVTRGFPALRSQSAS